MVSNLSAGETACVAALPAMSLRNFSEVERDLRTVLLRLKNTFDPKGKAELLRKLRELLQEADFIIAQ
jgi:hypothetical protein